MIFTEVLLTMKGLLAFLSLVLFSSVLFAMDEKYSQYPGYAKAKGVYYYYDASTQNIGTRSPASIEKVRKENKKTLKLKNATKNEKKINNK